MLKHLYPLFLLPLIFYSLITRDFEHPFENLMDRYKPFVTIKFRGGQLGNQFFQVATLLALSYDHDAKALFPENATWSGKDNLPQNVEEIFFRLPFQRVYKRRISTVFKENFHKKQIPIPYTPNMRLDGFFQSERYFSKYRDKICKLFFPSKKIDDYLNQNYSHLLNHPKTVALHVRTFYYDYLRDGNKLYDSFPPPDIYYMKSALSLFDQSYQIVVFSDYMP